MVNVKASRKKAVLLFQKGLNESFKKDYTKAIKYIEDSQKYFLEARDVVHVAECLAELALIHYQNNSNRLIRSLTLLSDAKALLLNYPQNTEIEAKIFHYYGKIYYKEKRYSEALRYFRNAQKLADIKSLEYAKILDSLAIFYIRLNNHEVATRYIKEALENKQRINDKHELALTKLLFGRYLLSMENFDEAYLYLTESLELIKDSEDNLTIARIQDEIAKIYIIKGDYDLAEEFCLKSLDIAKKIEASLLYAFSCCTFANIKIKKEKYEESIIILETQAQPIFLVNVSVRGYAFVKRLKAIAYNQLGKTKEAVENLHEAIELFKEAKVNVEIARSYFELSSIYKKSNDIPMTLSSLLESLQIAREHNLSILAKKIEDFIFEVDEEEWTSIINKMIRKEESFVESRPIIDTLALIGDIGKSDINFKNPLLSLLRIGRSITVETDIDKLLEIIAEETKAALNADRCTVFLLDSETSELWSKVSLGIEKQEIRFPANMGMAGHVIETGETINIKDAYNDFRFNKEIDKKTGYKTKTILCMPMRNLNHEVVGVFQVLNKLGNATFSDADEDLLIAIGSSAGIALENARLFKKQQAIYEEQKRSLISFMNTLAASIDAKDKITSGHSTRVTGYTINIAKQIGMPEEEIEVLEYAALLHDFGKIGIRDNVLLKEGKLTDEEYKHIQEHAFLTYEILKKMYFTGKFEKVPEIASSHHEKYDGSGYYRGIKGEKIPLGGRILAIADVFDAITSKRHYRERMPFLQVLNILRKDSGTHFDGKLVDEFFKINLAQIFEILVSNFNKHLTKKDTNLFLQYSINDLYNILIKNELERTKEENYLLNIFKKYYESQADNIIAS